MSLGRLIKAIFLFEGVKNMVLVINYIKRLRLLIFRYFRVKIYKNHTLRASLRGGTLVFPHLGGYAVLVRYLVLHRYLVYCGSYECR